MTHGKKGKARSEKKIQGSGKKAAVKAIKKGLAAAGQIVKGAKKQSAAAKKINRPAPAPPKAVPAAKGKLRPAAGDTAVTFTNPTVAAAFKHAVKKYPNAFRKLTD